MAIERNMRNIESDLEYENRIRPQELSTFAGQDKIVDHIAVAEYAYEAFISTRGARAMHRRGVMLTIHQVKFYRLTV